MAVEKKREAALFLESALRYASIGFKIFPLVPKQKRPLTKNGFLDASSDPDQIRTWWKETPNANIGVATGETSGILVIDVDTSKGKDGEGDLRKLEDQWGKLPEALESITGSGGRHLFFVYPTGFTIDSCQRLQGFSGIDIRANKGYVVLPPSDCVGKEAGHTIPYQFKDLNRSWEESLPRKWIDGLAFKPLQKQSFMPSDSSSDLKEIREALFSIPADLPHDEWVRVGFALYATSSQLGPLWHEWSSTCPDKYSERDAETAWKSFSKGRGDISTATLFFIAREHGYRRPPDPIIDEGDSWEHLLQTTKQGKISVNTHNLTLILLHDPILAGKIRYNEFTSESCFVNGSQIDAYEDWKVVRLAGSLEGRYSFSGIVSPKTLDGILDAVARNAPFHPIREYLKSVTWDGIPRIDYLFSCYYGTPDLDYYRAVSRNFMIGAVARVMRPGCKLDTMPILEGKQGTFKSTSLKMLFGTSWVSEVNVTPGHKDFHQNLRGKWCLEFADLDAFSRADHNQLKAQLTAPIDNYRASFGRRNADYPRQCVFAGTTNDDQYLKDATGGRRFWPIECRRINLEQLQKDRNQLWAEAYHRFQSWEPWHVINQREAETRQSDRYQHDSWEEIIAPWLEKHDQNPIASLKIYLSEILSECLDIPPGKHDRSHQIRVGNVMKRLGYGKKRDSIGLRDYYYCKIEED
jgi:predicted P-loop ATPase